MPIAFARFVPRAAAFALAVVLGNVARADLIILTTPAPDRSLGASARIDTNTSSNSDTTAAAGSYDKSVVANATTDPGGIAFATAAQNSAIPNLTGPAMSGDGNVTGVAVLDIGSDGSYSAQSVFSVFFTVDVTEDYFLSGLVSYAFPSGFDSGEASLTLLDVDNSDTLFSAIRTSDDFGDTPFATTVQLVAGVTYQLTANALTFDDLVGESEFSIGSATWEFSLVRSSATVVPEPSSAVLLAGGLAVLGLFGAQRRLRRAR